MRPTFINKNQFLDIKKISLGEKESIENDEEKNKYVEHMIKKSQAMVKKWKDSYEVCYFHHFSERVVEVEK